MSLLNMTALQAATTIPDLANVANDSTNGILFGMFMIGVFFIMLFVLKKYGFAEAFVSSSFSCFLLSAILAYGAFINLIFPLSFLAMTAFSLMLLYMQR